VDKRAVSILFDTYWSPAGWKAERERKTPKADLEYAKKQRVMFDPMPLDHTAIVSRLMSAVARITPQRVGDAFLASLSSRRLDWRSALGSYSVFNHLPMHQSMHSKRCAFCGLHLNGAEDLNVLNFERLKWGGVRHDYPTYALLDLELLLKESPPKPTPADVSLFDALIAAIDEEPSSTTSGALQKAFPAGLKSNKQERDTIVAVFGFCGALGTTDHPGFEEYFVPADSRPLPSRHFVDMAYPACWWRREEGFNRAALKPYFGHASSAV
jgi:hypothetical protein